MEINNNLQIALRVAGTKQRRAGFAPLVTIGVLAGGEGENMYRSTIVAERPAYVIKHAPGYILYQLIDRGAKPFDADANGVLSIALTISSNAQLADNRSPYNLLNEVYHKFVNTYMEPTSDGRLSFLDTDNDNEIFREIVSQYRLEERKSTYFAMAQQGLTGVVCVPKEKLEDFFINTQYKEFATFKDVEVGIACGAQVTPGLEKLQIPLPPISYDVWVNGKPVGVTMQSRTDSYYANSEGTSLYNYESVEFSLAELMDAPMNRLTKNGASISLDSQRNRINCDLKKVDILYNLVYQWDDKIGNSKDNILSLVKNGAIKLKYGTLDISKTLFGNFNIKASEIKGQKMEIKPQVIGNFSLYALSDVDHVKRQIITRIIINQRAIPTTQSTGRPLTPARISGKEKDNNNGIGNEDYFKRGDNGLKTETKLQLQDRKNMIDVKSLILGVVIGLGIGLGTWGIYSVLVKDSQNNTQPTPQPTPSSLIDTIPANPESASVNKSEVEHTEVMEPETDVETPSPDEIEAQKSKEREEQLRREKVAKAKENRAALIKFVGTKPSLIEYKKHPGYSTLSQSEKTAIESFLNPDQYKKQLNASALRNLKKKISESSYSFQTMEDIRKVQNDISSFLNDPNNK